MRIPALCLLLLLPMALPAPAASPGTSLDWWEKVSDTPGHHAFTDLAEFQGHYYLCYRTGAGHVSMDGVITILRSSDMRIWEHNATIKTLGDDRDPHLLATPDRLYVYFGVWDTIHGEGTNTPQRNKVRSHMASTADGESWSGVKGLYDPGWWLWRVNQIDDAFYTAGYTALRPAPDARHTRLLRSEDGVHWDLVTTVTREHMCGEADFWQRDDGSLAMVSRTGGGNPARLFTSNGDYTEWTDHELSEMVHAPKLAFWKDRVFVAGRGKKDGQSVTKLWELDGTDLRELLVLPSGGDTSYPGLLVIPESLEEAAPRLYISWYSQQDVVTGENEPDGGAGVYVGEITVHDGK